MLEFIKENLPQIWTYRARVCGGFIGFVAGLIWAFMGFWRAVAFIICVSLGYFIGKRIDQRGSLSEIFKRVFPPNE